MESLIESHNRSLEHLEVRFDRSLNVDWNDRLIGLSGARGVGKTTYLLNHIKYKLAPDAKALYVSMDDIYFTSSSLIEFADQWLKRGGTHLVIDEIHKYPNWSQELKNIYDRYRMLNVIFTGSSLLQIYSGKADLSRRAVVYTLHGLSFREFIQIETALSLPILTLEEIIKNHTEIAKEIVRQVKPLAYFDAYLNYGYYPFYLESLHSYHRKLMNTLNMMLEVDLPYLRHVEIKYVHKLKKLLHIIAHAVPFQPNVSKLSGDIEVARNTIMLYLSYLQESCIINLLHNQSASDTMLAKPEKVFLHHPNLHYTLSGRNFQARTLRESFFYNQVSNIYPVSASPHCDFLVDGHYNFEIGGKSKTRRQLKNAKEGFIAADDIEYGSGTTIPLWLFGFLY